MVRGDGVVVAVFRAMQTDQECPVCASENHKVVDRHRSKLGRDLHEQFHRQVLMVGRITFPTIEGDIYYPKIEA